MTDRELLIKISKEIDEHLQKEPVKPEPEDNYFTLEQRSDTSVVLKWNYNSVEDVLSTNTVRMEKGYDWMSFKELTNLDTNPESGIVWGGLQKDRTHYFKLKGTESEVIEYHIKEEDNEKPEPTPEPDTKAKKITIHEDSKWGIYTPTFKGFFKVDNKYRAYVFDRRNKKMGYFESDDLENWEKFQLAENQTKGTYFQLDNGDILFYRGKLKDEEGDDIKVFKVSKDFKKLTFYSSYDWRLDGALLWNQINGTIYSTGRIRGNSRDKDKGGWGGDIPPYPTVSDIPQIKDAFEEYAPDWMEESYIDNVLKDRRGISLHISKDNGKTWSKGKHIATPEDYDTPETAGWTQKNKNGVGDFYSSVFIDEKRMLVKLYKKEKDRVIERGRGDKNYPFQRRFRFTGETIIVPTLFENGKIKLLDNESVIPKEFHERPSHNTDNATRPGKMEVGQTQPFNIIEKNGYVYVLYGYRDDIHYENDYDFYAGIYIAKMPKEDFDEKFT